MKYLNDNRRKLQNQQSGQVTTQPVRSDFKRQSAAQTTAAAPAPMQKQNTAQQPVQKQVQPVARPQTQAQTSGQNAATGAAAQAQQLLSQQAGGYQSKWGSTIEDVLAQLMNPEEFSYDPNTDPLYLQLRDQYARDGQLAMEDTMGQAAQLTGGYGNSYAQMLGQQTYQGYMRNVNDMVPELRQQARAEYDAQNDALVQKLGLLMEQDNQDYGRYLDELERQRYAEQLEYDRSRDALADQRYDQEWQYQKEQDALANERYDREWEYQMGRDAVADERYNREWEYQMGRDQVADSRYDQEWQYQLEQDALANERYDREWEYQQNRDAVSDQRYNQEWEYQQSRDEVADQRYNQEWEYQQIQDALANERYDQEWEYQQGRDQVADERYNQEWEYQQSRDAVADSRYEDELAYDREQDAYDRQQDSYDQLLEMIITTGYKPSAAELAAAGMTEAQARAWLGYYTGSQYTGSSGGSVSTSSSSSYGSGSGVNNGTLTAEQVKELQAALGVSADGKYGPNSRNAAGGLSAEEAYEKFVGGSGNDSENNSDDNKEPSFTQMLANLKDVGTSPEEAAELIDAMVADGVIDPGQAAGLKHIWAR